MYQNGPDWILFSFPLFSFRVCTLLYYNIASKRFNFGWFCIHWLTDQTSLTSESSSSSMLSSIEDPNVPSGGLEIGSNLLMLKLLDPLPPLVSRGASERLFWDVKDEFDVSSSERGSLLNELSPTTKCNKLIYPQSVHQDGIGTFFQNVGTPEALLVYQIFNSRSLFSLSLCLCFFFFFFFIRLAKPPSSSRPRGSALVLTFIGTISLPLSLSSPPIFIFNFIPDVALLGVPGRESPSPPPFGDKERSRDGLRFFVGGP